MTNPDVSSKKQSISALSNGIDILERLAASGSPLGVTQLAEASGLHKSTVSRILATLEEHSLVQQDDQTRKYQLGVGLASLAGPMLANLDLRRVGGAIMKEVTGSTLESTALVTFTGIDGVVIEHSASPKLVKHITPIGTRINRQHAASMQVFAAFSAPVERAAFYPDYMISRAEVDAMCERVLGQGFAINDGDTDPEEWSVAAPIFDHRGQLVGAALISVPRARITDFAARDLPGRVVNAAAEISRRLGYQGYVE